LAIMVLCVYIFRNFFRLKFLIRTQSTVSSWGLSVICGVLVLFAWLYPYIVIQTLYNNSSIVLDISQSLQFGGLRIVALLTVLLSGISAFLFSHPFISVLSSRGRAFQPMIAFAIGSLIFVAINESTGQAYLSSLV